MNDRLRDVLRVLGLLILVIAIFGIAFCASGCATSKSNVPCPEPLGPKIINVDVPKPCIIEIEPLPTADVPARPQYPGDDASDDDKEAWALLLGEAVEKSMKLFETRDDIWLQKVTEHNNALPKCSDIKPVH